jgi:hypothetical protein
MKWQSDGGGGDTMIVGIGDMIERMAMGIE